MADSGNGSNSWPGFLSELSKGFLILRDIFGYALPGAVFLGVGLLCRRFSLSDLQPAFGGDELPPVWLSAVLGIGACYVVGHLMAAIAYFPSNFRRYPKEEKAETCTDKKKEMWEKRDVERNKKLILVRAQQPELLIELDRQSTMAMMRGASGVALLLGSILFWAIPKTLPVGLMLSVAGILLLLVFYWSANPHIGRLAGATEEAAEEAAQAAPSPPSVPAITQLLQDGLNALTAARKKL